MPEMPEVETMVRDLQARLPGRTIVDAEVSWDRMIAHPAPPVFVASVRGRRMARVERRGKFALLHLEDGGILAVHRGMTGSLFLRGAEAPEDRFVRVRFRLDGGAELRFDDARKFGRLYLIERSTNGYEPPWQRLGVEPLSAEFTTAALAQGLVGRRGPIKPVLLSQKVVAGIGNIYADEALFRARIHPAKPAGRLSLQAIARLRQAIVDVLAGAIERRGTTFSTYRDVDGESGGNQHELLVFHRQGQPCIRCGAPIRRILLGGRGTHFCPRCQKL
jgi:formamidopyrimidine-DNA glycosylase